MNDAKISHKNSGRKHQIGEGIRRRIFGVSYDLRACPEVFNGILDFGIVVYKSGLGVVLELASWNLEVEITRS